MVAPPQYSPPLPQRGGYARFTCRSGPWAPSGAANAWAGLSDCYPAGYPAGKFSREMPISSGLNCDFAVPTRHGLSTLGAWARRCGGASRKTEIRDRAFAHPTRLLFDLITKL